MRPRAEYGDAIDAFLPLPTAVFHILVALADRDRHGYSIMQDVAQRTDGKVQLSAGTLYSAVEKVHIDPKAGGVIKLVATKSVPPVVTPAQPQVQQVDSNPGSGKRLAGVVVAGGSVLVIAALFIVVNLLTDLVYGWLNPRLEAVEA